MNRISASIQNYKSLDAKEKKTWRKEFMINNSLYFFLPLF